LISISKKFAAEQSVHNILLIGYFLLFYAYSILLHGHFFIDFIY
jgi:hypothetical protein